MSRSGAVRVRKQALHLFVFSFSFLIGSCFSAGYLEAAKPSNSLKSKAKQNREARIKLYERSLRRRLAFDPYPLLDLEISLERWKSATQLIEGMNRAGVALGAVTAESEEVIKKAVAQYPARLIPLTTSASQNDWMRTGSGYLSGIKRQLEGGAFGVGKLTWRPESLDQAQMTQASEALGAIFRLAVTKQCFLLLNMPPDDDGLELLERQLRSAPEAKVIWTQAGRILNLNALPGYGHGLLRALSHRHPRLFFTLTQAPPTQTDSPVPRKNHLYDPGGAFSREWRALLEARVGHFMAGNDSSPANPATYARRTLFFREKILEKISPPARKIIAYQNAWRLLMNRRWKP